MWDILDRDETRWVLPLSHPGIHGGEQHVLQPSISEGDDTTSFWHKLARGLFPSAPELLKLPVRHRYWLDVQKERHAQEDFLTPHSGRWDIMDSLVWAVSVPSPTYLRLL